MASRAIISAAHAAEAKYGALDWRGRLSPFLLDMAVPYKKGMLPAINPAIKPADWNENIPINILITEPTATIPSTIPSPNGTRNCSDPLKSLNNPLIDAISRSYTRKITASVAPLMPGITLAAPTAIPFKVKNKNGI
jgi:hypothetical protein